MYDITALYEAASVAEAIELRRAHPEARLIAGGSDLLVKIRDGKLTGAELISIRGIAELAGVCEMPDGTLKIGPLTSFSQLAADTLIRERMPVLGEAADEAERAFAGAPCTEETAREFARAAVAEISPRDSWRASRAFRLHVAEECAFRALCESVERAGGRL